MILGLLLGSWKMEYCTKNCSGVTERRVPKRQGSLWLAALPSKQGHWPGV